MAFSPAKPGERLTWSFETVGRGDNYPPKVVGATIIVPP
jgi:hypothetical protein